MSEKGVNKKIIVWGIGKYYSEKEIWLKKNYEIIGYVSKKNCDLDGMIQLEDIHKYTYDYLVIMAHKYVFEIVEEIKSLSIPSTKIILGENILPHIDEESRIMVAGSYIYVNDNGKIIYEYRNHRYEINDEKDWLSLKELHISSNSIFKELSVLPRRRQFQNDGGKHISRYYIDKFLKKYSDYITGKVVEVGDRRYTRDYGKSVTESWVLDIQSSQESFYYQGNLETGENIQEEFADCIIATSVLGCIFNVQEAARNIVKMLKMGGHALITTTGIAPVSRYDMERWGYYWKFTDDSIRRLFVEAMNSVEIEVEVEIYGNAKSCSAYLYGIVDSELTESDLEYQDPDYQLIVAACVTKGQKNDRK